MVPNLPLSLILLFAQLDFPPNCRLVLKNTVQLPLTFKLKAAGPFSLDATEFELQPQEEAAINVLFDPSYKDDRQSHMAKGKVLATFYNPSHPFRESFEIEGSVNFPNVALEFSKIDFGCVLNDTTRAMRCKITNTSSVSAIYQWVFEEDEDAGKQASTLKNPYIPVNEVFDIVSAKLDYV